MNNAKKIETWFDLFRILVAVAVAYVIALMINQFGGLLAGNVSVPGLIVAFACLAGIIYMLFFKKYTEAVKLTTLVKVN